VRASVRGYRDAIAGRENLPAADLTAIADLTIIADLVRPYRQPVLFLRNSCVKTTFGTASTIKACGQQGKPLVLRLRIVA